MLRPPDVLKSWRQSRPVRRAVIGFAILTQFAAVWACNPDKSTVPPVAGVGSVQLEVVPVLAQVAQGAEFVASMRITRAGTFTGAVQLTVMDLPPGVTVRYSPSNIVPAGVSTASVTIMVAANAPLGFAPTMNFAAVGDGVAGSAQFVVRVISPATLGVSGTLVPATFDLFPGQTQDGSLVLIRQGGFTGAVQVRLTGTLPAGVTSMLVQETGNSDRYLLRFMAATSAPPANEGFGVELTGTGLPGRPEVLSGLIRVLPTPSVALSLSRERLAAPITASDTTTVFSVRSTGNTGALSYALVGAPAGITATFTADDITQSKVAVRLSSTNAVAFGTYTVSIRVSGTMNGIAFESMIPLQFRVLSPTGVDYSLILSDVTAAQGATVTSNVGIIRNGGFAGTITLFIDAPFGANNPTDLRVTVAPAQATGNSATITVMAGASVAAGTYRYILSSNAPNIADAVKVPFSVVVTAPRRATTITLVQLVNGTPQSPTNLPLPAGTQRSFAAVVQDQNAQVLANEPVLWTSSNTQIADVTPGGVVTGLAAGTATITATPVNNPNNIRGAIAITVTAAAGSAVTHIEIEPTNSLITAPGVQTFRARLFNAAGAQIAKDANGTLEFISSNSAVAEVTSFGVRSGVDTAAVTGKAGGTVTVTARYLVAGQVQRSDATSLTVNAPGTPNSLASVHISTAGDVRTLQRGQTVLFQLIVRNVAGQLVTSGLTPTIDLFDPSIISIAPTTIGQPGFFYTMTAAANAPIGSSVLVRYTVAGASGSTRIQIVP